MADDLEMHFAQQRINELESQLNRAQSAMHAMVSGWRDDLENGDEDEVLREMGEFLDGRKADT